MKFKLILALLLMPFSLMAATNQFSNVLVNDTLRSSNTFVRGYLGVTTNGPLSGSTTVVIRPRDATPTINQLELKADGAGNTAAFRFGDFTTGPIGLLGTDGAGNGRLNWDVVGTFTINVEGEAVLTATESLIIYGSNASDAHTWNGSTWTTANPVSWNSGLLSIPAAGGTISNNTSFVSLNMVQASNIVATTTTGTSSISSGTNLTFTIDAAGGAGTLITQAMFTMSTNTLNAAATPTVNVIYTNNSSRLMVTAGVTIPSGITTSSAVALWSLSGSMTNITAPVSSSPGVAGVVTNFTLGLVQPNGLYMITNINTAAGAPAIIVPNYRETRF